MASVITEQRMKAVMRSGHHPLPHRDPNTRMQRLEERAEFLMLYPECMLIWLHAWSLYDGIYRPHHWTYWERGWLKRVRS